MNAAERGAFFSDPLDGVVEIIVSGFALLYPTYLAHFTKNIAVNIGGCVSLELIINRPLCHIFKSHLHKW